MYRINKLLQVDQKLFHTNDLAILWGMANRSTLYITISRYIDKRVLFPIFKGLYSTVPLSSLDPLELGRAVIHRFTYLTTESVLAQAGVISQAVYDFTFATDISKRIAIGPWSFRYRKLKNEHLYNPSGITVHNSVAIATTERAIADMWYFNPHYHFDSLESVDLDKVKTIQKEIGYSHD